MDRLKYISIKIGPNPNPSEQDHCYTNDDSIEVKYEFICDDGQMTGRYVSMLPAQNKTIMNFCEFVVMGHVKIDCSMCKTSCNEVTGCDSCGPGLMLPDCKRSCPDGYAGINCMNKCNCASNAVCDHVSGNCPGECAQWWVPDVLCNKYIRLEWPIDDEDNIRDVNVTYSSITINWHGIDNIPTGYENHYQYTIHYTSKNNKGDTLNVQHKTTMAGNMTYTLTYLVWNTNYTIWITAYRVWKTEREAGETIWITTKTKCADPEPPNMDMQDRNDELIMRPQNVEDFASRCDRINSYYLSYECQTKGGFSRSEYNISVLHNFHDKDHSIYYGTTPLNCTAWLDVWNNDGFSARRTYTFSNIDTKKSETSTNSPEAETIFTTESNTTPTTASANDDDKGLGVIIKGLVGGGSGLLICVVIVVTCVVVKRRNESSQTSMEAMGIPKLQNGQNENSDTDNYEYDTITANTNIGYHHDESDGYQALDFGTGTQ